MKQEFVGLIALFFLSIFFILIGQFFYKDKIDKVVNFEGSFISFIGALFFYVSIIGFIILFLISTVQ